MDIYDYDFFCHCATYMTSGPACRFSSLSLFQIFRTYLQIYVVAFFIIGIVLYMQYTQRFFDSRFVQVMTLLLLSLCDNGRSVSRPAAKIERLISVFLCVWVCVCVCVCVEVLRRRRYGRTAASTLFVQLCDKDEEKDDQFFFHWLGKPEILGENPVPVPLCPLLIPHRLTRNPRWEAGD
jgi:uncharacterized membrane protein